jgi:hypothetical protein
MLIAHPIILFTRSTADLPTYQSKYHTISLHQPLQNRTKDIQYSIELDTLKSSQFPSHKPIYELRAALSRRFAFVFVFVSML